MIPIIYEKTETAFTSMGLGLLPDCILCEVTEELNGEFDLELRYPRSGRRFDLIEVDRILFVKPNDVDDVQPFRIYKIQKSIGNTITVFARHISYDLLKLTVRGHPTGDMNLYLLNRWCINNCFPANKNIFTITYDSIFYHEGTQDEIWIPVEYLKVPFVIRSLIGDAIKVLGAEMKWDKFTVNFLHRRGVEDSGIVVEYGKNLVSLEADFDYSNTADGLVPYYIKPDGTILMDDTDGHTGVIWGPGVTNPQTATPIDLTNEANKYFQEHGWAIQDIRDSSIRLYIANIAYQMILKDNPIFPENGISLHFVDIPGVVGQKKVGLGDTVTVRYPQLGIEQSLRVVRTVYNSLLERYNNIDLGEVKKDIAQITKNVDNDSANIANGTYEGAFINGEEINSPKLSGETEIHGYARVYGDNGAYLGGYVGAAKGSSGDETTIGVALSHNVKPESITDSSQGNYIIVTSGGVRLHSGNNNLYLTPVWAYLNGRPIAVQEDE